MTYPILHWLFHILKQFIFCLSLKPAVISFQHQYILGLIFAKSCVAFPLFEGELSIRYWFGQFWLFDSRPCLVKIGLFGDLLLHMMSYDESQLRFFPHYLVLDAWYMLHLCGNFSFDYVVCDFLYITFVCTNQFLFFLFITVVKAWKMHYVHVAKELKLEKFWFTVMGIMGNRLVMLLLSLCC